MFARTPAGDQLGTTIGTDGPYRIDTLLLDNKIVSGYGMVFVPLALHRPEPTDSTWTKVVVVSGEHTGCFGFVKIEEDMSDMEATKGLLQTH